MKTNFIGCEIDLFYRKNTMRTPLDMSHLYFGTMFNFRLINYEIVIKLIMRSSMIKSKQPALSTI